MIQHQLEARIVRMLSDFDRMLPIFTEAAELFSVDPDGVRIPLPNPAVWGDALWQNYEVCLHVPTAPEGRKNYLYLTTGREGQWDACNPQFEARINGRLIQAFDVNHIRMPLDHSGDVCVALRGYCCGSELKTSHPIIRAELRQINTELEQLIYDVCVPFEAATLLPAGEREREVTLETIASAIDLLDLRVPNSPSFDASVAEARHYMKDHYYSVRERILPLAYADCIGHTHIDVAWLWDMEQSRHKAVRSFSTVCDLMDRYPEYHFMSSQPVLYEFVKQDEPELYSRIKQRVAEGRWEVEGGMWVEADCNISGGEALARQFLYGQRFFREEFGKRCRVLWLPDVFGYSAALPQLMKLSGIDFFMTTKISWNEFNQMPYDTFLWNGIDGTGILTHFSPVRDYYSANIGEGYHRHSDYFTTYTSIMNPSEIAGGWKRFTQKGLDDHFLVLYGYGDGGGGPTDAMLERARRMKVPMPLTPVVRQEFARTFFEKLEERVADSAQLPVWSGELYLEFHRGTYTSQSRNKLFNRKAELALRRAELRCVQTGMDHKQVLDEVWHDVLTLQFHDILPGSSIHKVYEDSDRTYGRCFDRLNSIVGQTEALLMEEEHNTLCVFNDLDFERNDLVVFKPDRAVGSLVNEHGRQFPVEKSGDCCIAYVEELAPFAANNFRFSQRNCDECKLRVDRDGFETPFYRGRFDESMRIVSLYDKRAERELCREGMALNRLVCYECKPHNYDAWDINIYYNRKHWEINQVTEVTPIGNGSVFAGLRITWSYMSSTVTQEILFYADSPRIDFRTHMFWQEQTYIVKAHFPLDVFHNDIRCDIQYGNISRPTCRNTSWDVARFEICAHKWVDISESDYGVALLNDCKYGHGASNDEITLTLLKTSHYPDETADLGEHSFSYALFPHCGDWREGDVISEAYKFNIPAEAVCNARGKNTQPFIRLEGKGAVIEAIKPVENGSGTVVRLYECFGGRRMVKLKPGFAFKYADVVNILEEPSERLPVKDNAVELMLKPYQILSIRLSNELP